MQIGWTPAVNRTAIIHVEAKLPHPIHRFRNDVLFIVAGDDYRQQLSSGVAFIARPH